MFSISESGFSIWLWIEVNYSLAYVCMCHNSSIVGLVQYHVTRHSNGAKLLQRQGPDYATSNYKCLVQIEIWHLIKIISKVLFSIRCFGSNCVMNSFIVRCKSPSMFFIILCQLLLIMARSLSYTVVQGAGTTGTLKLFPWFVHTSILSQKTPHTSFQFLQPGCMRF